jgi:MFS family permease
MELRAATQGLITFITYGAGMLAGSWLSGSVVERYAVATGGGLLTHDWRSIWMIAGTCAAVVLVYFLLNFSESAPAARPALQPERA